MVGRPSAAGVKILAPQFEALRLAKGDGKPSLCEVKRT